MSSDKIVTITEQNFQTEVLQSVTPVLVDFWAPWCGPCKMIAPVLDEIAEEKAGTVKIGKVNVDDNGGLSQKFGVRAIPTLLIFKGGEVVSQVVGMAGKKDLIAKLDAAM